MDQNYTQRIYDSILRLLANSTSLQQLHANISENQLNRGPTEYQVKNLLDLGKVFELLNANTKIKDFNLVAPQGQITYKLPSTQSNTLSLNTYFPYFPDDKTSNVFNQLNFTFDRISSFDNRILHMDRLDISEIDDLCKSIATCKKVKEINLMSQVTGEKAQKCLMYNNFEANSQIPFFSRLTGLQLEHVRLNIPVNQRILDSIAELIEKSSTLKSFIFQKETRNQFYLDYTRLCSALKNCKTLQ